jgi:hypothetical protein
MGSRLCLSYVPGLGASGECQCIGVLKQVADTHRTKYKIQEARKYRRSFLHLHPHAKLNTRHNIQQAKTGRTLKTDDDNEITTF